MTLLSLQGLTKTFHAQRFGTVAPAPAVKSVSLAVREGETLGIVGESGSGKSTLLRMVLRLLKPTSGDILYRGRNIWNLPRHELMALRREMQPIFQDPASSFNPRQTIGAILSAPLEVHGEGRSEDRMDRVLEILFQVGLSSELVHRYPHQLSGGQKQRVAIARAIILKPRLVLADEPTSALDVSVQAQILNLFRDTKSKLALTMVFVSHNLAVVRYLSDYVAVMRRGEIVEEGPIDEVFSSPRHPYTQALLDAVPDPHRRRADRRAKE